MKTVISIIQTCTPVLLITLILMGCATSPTPRFYLLRAENEGATAAVDAPMVIVRPVEIADYLDRPQIVIRKNSREIAHAQFDRWAEPLDKQINLYLTSSLAGALENFNMQSFFLHEENKAKYEIVVAILTLDGSPEGEVKLDARWKIHSAGENRHTLKDGHIKLSKTCPKPGMPGVVAATEMLLNELSNTIADALKKCR